MIFIILFYLYFEIVLCSDNNNQLNFNRDPSSFNKYNSKSNLPNENEYTSFEDQFKSNSNTKSVAVTNFDPKYKFNPLNENKKFQPNVQHPQEINPLMKKASETSICLLFLLLTWRTISVYELADSFSSSYMRFVTVLPIMLIFCSNIIGFALNISKPANFKSYMKLILALNTIREFVEAFYNIFMIVIRTSEYNTIPKEVYFGRFFSNIWWLSLCTSFSRSRWVMNSILGATNKNKNQNSFGTNYPAESKSYYN